MRYPVALYQPRLSDFDLATDTSWLKAQDLRQVRLDWFNGLRVFDAAGIERRVREARIVNERRRRFGLRRECDLVLIFEGVERPISLAELAALVCKAAEVDASLWEYREDANDKASFQALVRASQSHEEVIRLLEGGVPTAP